MGASINAPVDAHAQQLNQSTVFLLLARMEPAQLNLFFSEKWLGKLLITIPCKRSLVLEHSKNQEQSIQSTVLEDDSDKPELAGQSTKTGCHERSDQDPKVVTAGDAIDSAARA
ncbi:unnamed protein product [Urochloa humidicola]